MSRQCEVWEWELEVETSIGTRESLALMAEYVLETEGTDIRLEDLKLSGAHECWEDEVSWDFWNIQFPKIIAQHEAQEAQNGRT